MTRRYSLLTAIVGIKGDGSNTNGNSNWYQPTREFLRFRNLPGGRWVITMEMSGRRQRAIQRDDCGAVSGLVNGRRPLNMTGASSRVIGARGCRYWLKPPSSPVNGPSFETKRGPFRMEPLDGATAAVTVTAHANRESCVQQNAGPATLGGHFADFRSLCASCVGVPGRCFRAGRREYP